MHQPEHSERLSGVRGEFGRLFTWREWSGQLGAQPLTPVVGALLWDLSACPRLSACPEIGERGVELRRVLTHVETDSRKPEGFHFAPNRTDYRLSERAAAAESERLLDGAQIGDQRFGG